MAKELKQLAAVNPSAGVLTSAYTVPSGGLSMAAVAITNADMADIRFDITITNTGKDISVCSSQILQGRCSYETSKFAISAGDHINIKSTNSYTHFVITGMNQSEI
jgi:hypothetical protein